MGDSLPDRHPPIANPMFEIWRLSRRTGALVDASLNGEQTASDFGLYSLIRNLGSTTATELAELTGSGISTISQQLRRLEERGHLTRTPHPDDGRSTLVALTDAGRDLHGKAGPGYGMLEADLRDELGEDGPMVMYALRQLDEALCRLLGIELDDAASVPRFDALPLDHGTLSADQMAEVRRFIAWVRWRDDQPAAEA